MNKFFKILLLLIASYFVSNCSKSDPYPTEPIRDYTVQYNTDITDIETFLKTHKIQIDGSNNVTYVDVTTGSTDAIWADSRLTYRIFNHNSIDYKIYYLKFADGIGASPCNVDKVLVAYKGCLLDKTVFDYNDTPQNFFSLENVILGWSEILPQFKTGTYSSNSNGSLSFSNYGEGLIFIPSGLGYYSVSQTNIPAYSPLIFNIKLYEITRQDHDGDGIPDYQEDINRDGYIYNLDSGVYNVDDTDGDGHADYLDLDDDDDHVLTKVEIKNPLTSLPYDYALIPGCDGLSTDPNRIRVHLIKCP